MDDQKESYRDLLVDELNSTIRVLLSNRSDELEKLKNNIQSNIDEMIMPYVNRIKTTRLNKTQQAYLDIIEHSIKDIFSTYNNDINKLADGLTIREKQIISLIREGKTSKEIAELLHISKRTVDTHRLSIRKKLRIKNKKVNLITFLISME